MLFKKYSESNEIVCVWDEIVTQMANFDIIANKDCLKSTIVYARYIY